MSAAPKFTPGPWRIDDGSIYKEHDDYHGIDAAQGYFSFNHGDEDTGFSLSGYLSIHNARLIAASPELYEALREIADEAERAATMDYRFAPIMAKARAVLAKVTP